MSDPLAAVRKAAERKRQAAIAYQTATDEYRAACVRAHAQLVAAGHPAPFSALAKAAGIKRQGARQLVNRALA